VRAGAAEAALVGRRLDAAAAAEIADLAVADVTPTGDIHGSSEYRRELARTLVCRGLLQADAHVDTRTAEASA
jgi:carbon-monoxide dehydrogenase medium subunit